MKKYGIVFVAVLLLAGSAWGQYGYLYQSGGWMFGADFIGQEGWMVGGGGAILHTQDGGRNWLFQRNIQSYDAANPEIFNAVTFKTTRQGWALSNSSRRIWRTADGGQFWEAESLNSGVPVPAEMVSFGDTLSGWIVCPLGSTGYIQATTDGGRTWSIQSPNHSYEGVYASSQRHCWAVGGLGWTARTTNGGQNWFEQQIGSVSSLDGVVFTDTLFGWACGASGVVVHTTDGGVSWTQQTSGTSRQLNALRFLGRMRGFAVGDTGTLIKTTNGGASWTSIPTGVDVDFASISFGDSLHGWVIGVEGGTILETSDGGSSWRVSQKGIAGPVNYWAGGLARISERVQAISFVDDSTGWAASWEGNIWLTRDGGKIWNKQVSVSRKRLLGLAMADANTGWAVGDSGRVIATTNGGTIWTPQASGLARTLTAVFASNSQYAWASGYGQRVIGTSNGGGTWGVQYTGDSTGFASVGDARPSRAALVCGSNGLLLRTSNGSTWSRVTGPTTNNLWGISFGDEQKAWAAGWKGIRLNTTDQGVSWQIQQQDPVYDSLLMSVQAFDAQTARAVGYLGRSVLTTDGGTTWVNEETGTDGWLLASSFRSPTLGWVAGEDGMVLKYGLLPSGVEAEGKGPALNWKTVLEQNRPNPFFAGTRIRYQLSRQGPVRLVVYNVLGQSVRKLVNEEQKPGAYEVSWDGKDGSGHTISGGIYFYRLEASGQCRIRKIVKVR